MIFIGAVLLTIERGKLFKKLSNIGVQLTIVSALLIAITSIVDKMAMGYWPPAMYGFFVYLVPGSILGGFTLKRIDKFVRLVKSVTPLIVIAALFDVLAYYFLLNAYSLTEVSKVYPIVQLSVLFAVIGGIILLKEKKDILPKLIGAIIMILGAILISGVM
jgi:drug/metabolite transporter (DMT)-like permease